jgi:protein farnesyltransferase/geranylgeranyltransferase type-1 subunit alpha
MVERRKSGKCRRGSEAETDRYAVTAIHLIPHNVSAWNYLRGSVHRIRFTEHANSLSLLNHFKLPLWPLLPTFAPYAAGSAAPSAPAVSLHEYPQPSDPLPKDTPLPVALALEFAADALVEQGRLSEAAMVYEELSEKHDRMRAGYWEFRKRSCE